MSVIDNKYPIHFVWIGEIPITVRNNIIYAALLHQHEREVILWISKNEKNREITENEKQQHKLLNNIKIISLKEIENLENNDVVIFEQIFKNNRLAIKEKLKSASDFIRIVILNQYEGIYLDGDVELKRSLPRFLYACYGILLNIKIKKNDNYKLYFDTDFYDVTVVTKHSKIISKVINELREELDQKNNPTYDVGELVKIQKIVNYIIENNFKEEEKEILYDANSQYIGVDFYSMKNNLYFSLKTFRKMAFPSELFSSFDIGYQHGSNNWNEINETEYNKQRRLQKISEEYAKQIKIIENISIMITFEGNYSEKNKFLFQKHFQKLKEIYNEYIWIIINIKTDLGENKLKVIEWSNKSKDEINIEGKKREYSLNYQVEEKQKNTTKFL
ncbi:glycosyltransferase [Spiroplasma endosymbiont of Panzeria rudis]|uniref:glycosyltransferase n=1 Tax=Spiroplasma endosymbiont of Panzeria rudis TaxID=3066301 RepID=UPI0030CFCDA3